MEQGENCCKKQQINFRTYLKFLYRLYPPWKGLAEYRVALELVEKYGCRSVLDVGCGRGNLGRLLSKYFPSVAYVGIDVHNMFAGLNSLDFVVADGRSPPMRCCFDCIFLVNSLFYMGVDTLDVYKGLGRVVIVIDIDPSYPHVWLVDMLESGFKGMRRRRVELISILRDRGFKVLDEGGKITYYVVATGVEDTSNR